MKIIAFLLLLCSYTYAGAQMRTNITASEKKALIDAVAVQLEKFYVFPDKAKHMGAYLKQKEKEKKYATITDYKTFVDSLRSDLQNAHTDKHLNIAYNPEQAGRMQARQMATAPPADVMNERREWERKSNYGFTKTERLNGNIGYIDFRSFQSVHSASENTVAAAMGFIENADAVIIDLRNNGGGDPRMVQLILSYFMDEKPVHYNSIYSRQSNSTEDFYSLEKVKGTKMPGIPLYILTSNYTFSAAEEFAYNFKNLKRAILVGETTGGGAHPTGMYVVNDKVVMAIPDARSINPISKTNWEGTGVEPDVKIEASKALAKAQQMILKELMAKALNPAEKRTLEWQYAALSAELAPVLLTDKIISTYAGTYGDRNITLENGVLFYQRTGRPKLKLMPMTEDVFKVEGLDYFRLQFVKNGEGNVEKLVGLYDNGQKDESQKTTKSF